MTEDSDTLPCGGSPILLKKTALLKEYLCARSFAELKAVWKCNDKIAEQNFDRLRDMRLVGENLTPAVVAYDGIQYQYLSPKTLDEGALSYINKNLYILSGFYGILRPFDSVCPYRLEMQAVLSPPLALPSGEIKSLYNFWGRDLYDALTREDREAGNSSVIINLASKEYSRAIEPYISDKDSFITCVFAERVEGRLRQKATMAKMARGEMVRYMAESSVERAGELKHFRGLGFRFSEADSDERTYVFVK